MNLVNMNLIIVCSSAFCLKYKTVSLQQEHSTTAAKGKAFIWTKNLHFQ
jgi:hypothetical protein